ncbi:MAG TPA: Gfo/Idh/MocA family oxidoreductase [Ruminiclostridium sp.]
MSIYKIVLVGCGSMSHEWIKYALQSSDCEIVALVDVFIDNANKINQEFNLNCPVFYNLKEAISTTNATLVFDVTIPASHMKVVTEAMRAGCNVMGEKPMATSIIEAREILAVQKETNKSYSVMQNRRFVKNIRAYKNIVQSGQIGKSGMVCADFFLGPHFGGFRDLMDSPLILDMAIHTFDQARFITGSDPVSVYCHEFNPVGSWYRGNASAICIFEFADNSAFCYRGSWCSEGCPTSWESSWRVTGSEGTAMWDGTNLPYAEAVKLSDSNPFHNECEKLELDISWNGREGHLGCLDEMFLALKEGRAAETDCRDNIQSILMVYGAIESSKTGKKVLLDSM